MIIPSRYKPTGRYASGGMGDIIECLDQNLNRPVILKKLQAGGEHRRIIDEQKALMKLRSKHVVQILDIIPITSGKNSEHAVVLEYIDGSDLTPHSFVCHLDYYMTLWQIACGLRDTHSMGVVHRDIKPNNLRRDSEGVVKIIDFGLARSMGPAAETIGAVGTPIYMAPELWSITRVNFTTAVDVYAFAVTAIALLNLPVPPELCHRPPLPFRRGALAALKSSGNPHTLALREMPDQLIDVLERCLSQKVEDRPPIAEVEGILADRLLEDRHRALLVTDSAIHELNSAKRTTTLKIGDEPSLSILYDGHKFKISNVKGTVLVNNRPAIVGQDLHSSCVIGFVKNSHRKFMTFDVSHPEILL